VSGARLAGVVMDSTTLPPVRAGHAAVVLVSLDHQRLALPLESVLEVLPAMAHTPLPTAPDVVLGVVNLRGAPLPLLDLRTRLGGRPRPPRPDDHVVVCQVGSRNVGVWLDHVEGTDELDTQGMVPVSEVADARHVQGVALLPDGTVLVCDVRSFLSADEALRLDDALASSTVVVSA
jgi:purine-binding chemotaxis protein CheW